MNTKDYDRKALELLSDTNTYTKDNKVPTNKYAKTLSDILRKLKDDHTINVPTYRRLLPIALTPTKCYGLLKIHKATVPLCPIIASRGSPTYDTARFVAAILKPLVGKSPYHLNNSQELMNKLKDVVLEPDEEMVSFEVTALFTKVPIEESITIIWECLSNDNTLEDRTSHSVDNITELLRCCLTTTYFVLRGVFYTQIERADMGSPVSPIVFNLFMENFESRYANDTFFIIKSALKDQFTEHINTQHPSYLFFLKYRHVSVKESQTHIEKNM